MRKYTKEWYFAAASANDLWISTEDLLLSDSEKLTGAPKNCTDVLFDECLANIIRDDTSEGILDSTYLCVQYGLEKSQV